jgi:hypothetical protein
LLQSIGNITSRPPATTPKSSTGGKYRRREITKGEYLKRVQAASGDPLTENGSDNNETNLEAALASFLNTITNDNNLDQTRSAKKTMTACDRLKMINQSIEATKENKREYTELGMEAEAEEAKNELVKLLKKRANIVKELEDNSSNASRDADANTSSTK